MLSAARLRELLDYNPETGIFTRLVTASHNAKKGMRAGSINDDGYRYISVDGERYRAQRLGWLYVHGEWPSCEVDHINRVRDDNCISNLRLCPISAHSAANRGCRSDNRLGLKGVGRTVGAKYFARITVDGRIKHLGTFPTLEDASTAYKAAAIEAFGEFATF